MSGGSETTTTTIPDWIRPYAENFMGRAQQVSDLPYQAYDGQTVAGLNPYQTQALDATAQRAIQGSPVTDAASSELQRTLSGGYLNNNPHMDSLVNQAQGDVIRNYQTAIAPQIDALDARSGSFGNSGVQHVLGESRYQLGQTLGDISTNLRGNDYAAERGRMQGAVGMAPSIANQDYADAQQLYGAGSTLQGQEQAQMNDAYGRFTEARNYPRQQLDTMGRGLGLNFGSSTSGPGANPWAQGLGGAMAAYGLYNNMGSSSGGGK